MYSTDGVSWQIYKNNDNETFAREQEEKWDNAECPHAGNHRTIYPSLSCELFLFRCMRVELYGCTFSCGESLGQEPGKHCNRGYPDGRSGLFVVCELAKHHKTTF
ncbi:hypothetical protein OS493_013293 [Desmophyllum pertusum]|uniref:F5/8 type C domain-containing protein n=1 Tax=Desmophyllum pertusum TaxID=174260 RepID=A0A9X0CLK1_9CNID|nr:hypothetical protein OS493_013293 [Desmophyllum pertusum]